MASTYPEVSVVGQNIQKKSVEDKFFMFHTEDSNRNHLISLGGYFLGVIRAFLGNMT